MAPQQSFGQGQLGEGGEVSSDLRDLIDDLRFRAYHRELLKPREFNTFDVLQYADYEIRHSNVLAWLLRPGDTHGIGPRFLKWFVDHVHGRLPAGDRVRVVETSFEQANIDVWRERDYVDITIRFKREKCLIAVENKLDPASSGHLRQIKRYVEELREKHKDHDVRGVLLSASPDGSVKFPDIAHVGWGAVVEEIGSYLEAGEFPSSSVEAFIRQYVEMVDRWLRPTGGKELKGLLEDHRSVLKEMRRILEKDGDDGVRGVVPQDRAEYSDSFTRLVRESRHDPKTLRGAVRDYLRGRGTAPSHSHNPSRTVYWLGWIDATLGDAVERMGGHRGSLSWSVAFSHHNVESTFYLYGESTEERAFVDRLKSCLEKTPINRQRTDGYSVWNDGYGWEGAYREELLSHDELLEMSAPEVTDEVIRRLAAFMDSDDSEYRRIDDYFQCLALGFEAGTRHSASQADHP